MTISEAEKILASRPIACTVLHECVLVHDEQTLHEQTIAKHLQRNEGDVAQVEYQANRRFVVAHLLDPLMEPPLRSVFAMTPAVYAAIGRIADTYAASLRAALRDAFPTRTFEVEMIGTDYVEDEPLEACVTFYHVD